VLCHKIIDITNRHIVALVLRNDLDFTVDRWQHATALRRRNLGTENESHCNGSEVVTASNRDWSVLVESRTVCYGNTLVHPSDFRFARPSSTPPTPALTNPAITRYWSTINPAETHLGMQFRSLSRDGTRFVQDRPGCLCPKPSFAITINTTYVAIVKRLESQYITGVNKVESLYMMFTEQESW
jgi:hypothetical protein